MRAAEDSVSVPVRLFDLDGDTQLDFPLLGVGGPPERDGEGEDREAARPGM